MTPKEKAKELFDKMYFANDPMRSYPMCYETAKQCALIAVEEIISICPYQTYIDTLCPYDGAELSVNYWNEVKQEIENYDNSEN